MRIEAVTGAQGAGKTNALLEAVRALAARGLRVGGVLQLVRFEGGQRVGYDLVRVGEGEGLAPVAELSAVEADPEHSARQAFARLKSSGRGFRFSEDLWLAAAEAISRGRRDADVLVVDELGWVEAEGGGHMPALTKSVAGERSRLWLLGVRADRREGIAERLGGFDRLWTVPDEAAELRSRAERRGLEGHTDGRTDEG